MGRCKNELKGQLVSVYNWVWNQEWVLAIVRLPKGWGWVVRSTSCLFQSACLHSCLLHR